MLLEEALGKTLHRRRFARPVVVLGRVAAGSCFGQHFERADASLLTRDGVCFLKTSSGRIRAVLRIVS